MAGRIRDKLPFLLQQEPEFHAHPWIDRFEVLSIKEWNQIYSNFPIQPVQQPSNQPVNQPANSSGNPSANQPPAP
jgi:hypothetical protein